MNFSQGHFIPYYDYDGSGNFEFSKFGENALISADTEFIKSLISYIRKLLKIQKVPNERDYDIIDKIIDMWSRIAKKKENSIRNEICESLKKATNKEYYFSDSFFRHDNYGKLIKHICSDERETIYKELPTPVVLAYEL